MSLLCDSEIAALQMISPFVPHKVRSGVLSYGLSSYGYDIRLASNFVVFHHERNGVIDPKHLDETLSMRVHGSHIDIAPGACVLGYSIELFSIPQDVLGICVGKSTYARCGLIINTTPLEPGWKGYLTVEMSNTNRLPIRVYANEGIAQILFLRGLTTCNHAYGNGIYQHQEARVVLARVAP